MVRMCQYYGWTKRKYRETFLRIILKIFRSNPRLRYNAMQAAIYIHLIRVYPDHYMYSGKISTELPIYFFLKLC